MNLLKNRKIVGIAFVLFVFTNVIFVFNNAQAIDTISTPENTLELCTDGIDNDDNGLTDFADASCLPFLNNGDDEDTSKPENTLELCTDGIDNDDNGLTDFADASCLPFLNNGDDEDTSTPENTLELCTDGIDNDDNGLTDFADASCLPFLNNGDDNGGEVEEPTTRSRSSGSRVTGSSSSPQGEVLGAFTGDEENSCGMYLTTYMRQGFNNNSEEVMKLQTFLNEFMNAGLPVTGYFGALTTKAVNDLQNKYATEILTPWNTIYTQISAVGYVYQTTRHFINNQKCPGSEAFPVLI
jgi:hypothetical protein